MLWPKLFGATGYGIMTQHYFNHIDIDNEASLFVLIGYMLLTINYIIESYEDAHKKVKDHETGKPIPTIGVIGYSILAIYYLKTIVVKSEHKFHIYNIFALVANMMGSDNNINMKYPFISYYILYLVNNMKNWDTIIGPLCLIIFYGFNE